MFGLLFIVAGFVPHVSRHSITLPKVKLISLKSVEVPKNVVADRIDPIKIQIPEEPIAPAPVETVPVPVIPKAKVTPKTTVPVEPQVSETPQVVDASGVDCGPRKMSIADAHACWDGLIGQYDWPFTRAFNTMYCESTGKYDDRNPSGATGLFQVKGGPIDPEANVAQAYSMWVERGWQPWVCKG